MRKLSSWRAIRGELNALPEMIADPEQEEQVAEILQMQSPGMSMKRARKPLES